MTAYPAFNPEIHSSEFKTNYAMSRTKDSAVFLPPINMSSVENLRSKVDMLIWEKDNTSHSPKRDQRKQGGTKHKRKDSETERRAIVKKIDVISQGRKASLNSYREDGSSMLISAFDGAHVAMPRYSNNYQSVKNLAPVENCLKG